MAATATKKRKKPREEEKARTMEPLGLNRVEAATLVGMKRTAFEEWDRDGRLGPQSFKMSGRRWSRAELTAWFINGRPRREAWVKLWPEIQAKEAARAEGGR